MNDTLHPDADPMAPAAPAPTPAPGMSNAVAQRFSEAAERYEAAAVVQRQAAELFHAWLQQQDLPSPRRIAEIGCGTGLLSRLLLARHPEAHLLMTDLAPGMVTHCRARFGKSDRLRYAVGDGLTIRFEPRPDWIVSAMCFQWFSPLGPVLRHHLEQCEVLAFSTLLDGSFSDWRAAHARAGVLHGLQPVPEFAALQAFCQELSRELGLEVRTHRITLHEAHADGLSFARSLRAIGADLPSARHQPVNLRPVLRQLRQGFSANYEIGFFCLRK